MTHALVGPVTEFTISTAIIVGQYRDPCATDVMLLFATLDDLSRAFSTAVFMFVFGVSIFRNMKMIFPNHKFYNCFDN